MYHADWKEHKMSMQTFFWDRKGVLVGSSDDLAILVVKPQRVLLDRMQTY